MTFRHGHFRLDSGAHRFHDKDSHVTDAIRGMTGESLQRVSTPSRIYGAGKFVDFPLSPLNLMRYFGVIGSVRADCQMIQSRYTRRNQAAEGLEDFASRTYGDSIAEHFLLSYSEKLLGEDDIVDRSVWRVEHAYPVIEIDSETKVSDILGFLKRFANLRVTGRNGRFAYVSIHNLLQMGREIAEAYTC